MRKSKTWNCALTAGRNSYGSAAAIASNDPAEYPLDGYGVEVSSHSSGTGDVRETAGMLLDEFVKNAVSNGITSVLVFSDIALYPESVHRETIEDCTVDVVVLDEMPGQGDGASFDPKDIRKKMALEAVEKELAKLKETAGTIASGHPPLVPGQYILYRNGDRYELGRVKRVTETGPFVWYSAGDTASKTPWDCVIPIENARNIIKTDLGGIEARDMFPDDEKGRTA